MAKCGSGLGERAHYPEQLVVHIAVEKKDNSFLIAVRFNDSVVCAMRMNHVLERALH
jgi:hypothetical protein